MRFAAESFAVDAHQVAARVVIDHCLPRLAILGAAQKQTAVRPEVVVHLQRHLEVQRLARRGQIDRRGVATVTLNRPESRNAMSAQLMREMIAKISKRSANKIVLYADPQPIFDRFNITRQLENAFSRQVHLKGGGYIVVDETEALVAIDVNTGRHKSQKDLETTIVQTNLEAAEEICRQLRLRNIGGLIVIDFIDMRNRSDQQKVTNKVREGVKRDKAKTRILNISQPPAPATIFKGSRKLPPAHTLAVRRGRPLPAPGLCGQQQRLRRPAVRLDA